ncbi:uncharacterized protein [Rutidosis leptorrhynchoides]|uniref:uncharacterized protein n=1 Tax=Rutidosis leptorrhynchoides TaxID=125765 RepID=UPI003A99DE67
MLWFGNSTSFWDDVWVGNNNMRSLFPRLYRLENSPNISVASLLAGSTVVSASIAGTAATVAAEIYGTTLPWRADSRVKDSDAVQFSGTTDLIHTDFGLDRNSGTVDGIESEIGSYTLDWIREPTGITKDELPVRIEPDIKGIDLHMVQCPLCDDDLESVDHSLIFCSHAQMVWDRVFKWGNRGHFHSFTINEILKDSSLGASHLWQAVIWISTYFIWKNRNNMVFQGKSWNASVALNEIQAISFEWISQRAKHTTSIGTLG